MKRRSFLAVLALLAAGCAGAPSRPVTVVEGGADWLDDGSLSLSLPLEIPFSALQDALESGVPRSWTEERSADVLPLLEHDRYRYVLGRGPAVLGVAAGRLTFQLPIAGQVTVSGRLPLLGLPIQETVELRGTVDGSAALTVGEDWSLDLAPEARLRLDAADILLPSGRRLDLRSFLQPRIDELLRRELASIGPGLGTALDLGERARALWQELHFARPVGEGAWLRFVPRGLTLVTPRLDEAGLHTGLAVEGRAALVLDRTFGRSAGAVPVGPLPALTLVASTDGRIAADLPIAAAAAELSPLVARALVGTRFRAGKKGRVVDIIGAALSTAGDTLVLALDFTAGAAGERRPARGRLSLSGRPAIDAAAGLLRLRDLDVDLTTGSALLRWAGWRNHRRLVAELERRAVFDLAPVLREVEAEARAAVQGLELPSGLRADLRLDPIQLLEVGVAGGTVVARCRITGTAAPIRLAVDGTLTGAVQ
jgi:hypothetical protein